jgi:hypothetical protein
MFGMKKRLERKEKILDDRATADGKIEKKK